MVRLDYTVALFETLLDAALESGYSFVPVRDVLAGDEPEGPHVVMRHDVDRRPENALALARVEADRGIEATYYVRTATASQSRLETIEALGHEVGYHYEDFVKAGGDYDRAFDRFEANLEWFREVVTVDTVAAHGNLSRYENVHLWDGDRSIETFDLLGEPYLSMDLGGDYTYRSDTDRLWDAKPDGPSTTPELIEEIRRREHDRICILAHPSRWTDGSLEYVYQLGWDAAATSTKRAFNGTAKVGTTATAKVREATRPLPRR